MKSKILIAIAGALLMLMAIPIQAQTQPLTADELAGLINVRLLDKFVSDVYIDLSDTWDAPLFSSISDAEADHTNSILGLYSIYGVFDELGDLTTGDFHNYQVSQFYEAMTALSNASFIDALYAAGETEEIRIVGLIYWLTQTNVPELLTVYNYQLAASENHLRAIVSELAIYGEKYAPQHLSFEMYNTIIFG